MYIFQIHVILQFLDAFYTLIGVYTLGIGTDIEGNPLVKYLMDTYTPILGMILVKLCAFTILLFLWKSYVKLNKNERVILYKTLFVLNCVYGFIVAQWFFILLFY